jgi:hypothetical protein
MALGAGAMCVCHAVLNELLFFRTVSVVKHGGDIFLSVIKCIYVFYVHHKILSLCVGASQIFLIVIWIFVSRSLL